MGTDTENKILLFVSTGRCGTVRLNEILKEKLDEGFIVNHQIKISRFANITGNILYYLNWDFDRFKSALFRKVLKKVENLNLISTDPLTSMMIPEKIIISENVCIIHIYRDAQKFAESFFRYTGIKKKSFIAHNFIPFWQINILPLQNYFLGRKIINKYRKTAEIKNNWFIKKYKKNIHFLSIDMKDVFSSNIIENKINEFFKANITINLDDLKVRSNTSD